MEQKLNIYGEARTKVYQKELKRLKEAKISDKNKKIITQFHNYLFSTGTGEIRVAKVSSQLRRLAKILNKDFDKVTKQDVQSLVAYINTKLTNGKGNSEALISEATKSDYRRTLRQLYFWFKEDDNRIYSRNETERITVIKLYKYIEDEIKISYKKKRADPSTIITEDDINIVIDRGCRNIKEKAFVKTLHESGTRIGEMLGIKIKDVFIKDNHVKIIVDGKTGLREIPLVSSMSYLSIWLQNHPFKENQNAYVWLGENRRCMWEPMHHNGAQKLIERVFERAGFVEKEYIDVELESGKKIRKLVSKKVKKKHNLHWFRHSRASILAPQLTESILCKFMGWVEGSKQVKNYVHLCTQQIDDAYLKIHGLNEKKEDNKNKPKKCSCSAINDSISRYCFRCGKPLTVEIMLQDQDLMKNEMDKSIKLLMEISKNPELLEAFEEFKKNQQKTI